MEPRDLYSTITTRLSVYAIIGPENGRAYETPVNRSYSGLRRDLRGSGPDGGHPWNEPGHDTGQQHKPAHLADAPRAKPAGQLQQPGLSGCVDNDADLHHGQNCNG